MRRMIIYLCEGQKLKVEHAGDARGMTRIIALQRKDKLLQFAFYDYDCTAIDVA